MYLRHVPYSRNYCWLCYTAVEDYLDTFEGVFCSSECRTEFEKSCPVTGESPSVAVVIKDILTDKIVDVIILPFVAEKKLDYLAGLTDMIERRYPADRIDITSTIISSWEQFNAEHPEIVNFIVKKENP